MRGVKSCGYRYTVNYQHVELVLNDYLCIYAITNQIERGKVRVNIDDDGFLIEDDGYYEKEPLFFYNIIDGM